MRVDAHTHFGPGADEARVDDLSVFDAYEFDRVVAFPGVRGLTGTPTTIAAANDYLADVMERDHGRVIGFCTVNPLHEEEAWEELERAALMGLRGLKLHPPLQGFVLSDHAILDPVLGRAARLGLPVVFHAGLRVAGLPHVSINLADLKLLADAHPQVTFVVAHMAWGGRDSHGIEELGRACPNVWFDTAGVNMPGSIRQLVDAGAADRIMYGSDFPFLHPKVELLRLELAELDAEVEAGILGRNAARLLGM